MDTVHKEPVKTICYSKDGTIIMSPEGIGGDDRAGVFMILQIIKKHRCHVLFCEDKEIGGVGAEQFAASDIRPEIKYMVELDRRGSNDAVFMSALAQFERDNIAERTREGLRSARARGKTGGRPKINPDDVKKAVKLYHTQQYSIKEIEELTGVKKSTLYRNIQEAAAAK